MALNRNSPSIVHCLEVALKMLPATSEEIMPKTGHGLSIVNQAMRHAIDEGKAHVGERRKHSINSCKVRVFHLGPDPGGEKPMTVINTPAKTNSAFVNQLNTGFVWLGVKL